MNRMQKTMAILLCMFAAISVYAGDGSSCTNAIQIIKDENQEFSYSVDKAKTVWFTARTFDLPIKVRFTPASGTATEANKPDVYLDFTCSTQGVYDDPILCDLFCPNSGSGISIDMPYKAVLEKEGNTYTISVGKQYRDLLLSAGISYNVDAYVRVVFKSAGSLSLVPDTEFADCMDGGKFMKLGDTIHIKANDTERYFILPFAQWTDDSIRFVWDGEKQWHFAFANTCQFDPNKVTDGNIIDNRLVVQPKDTIRYPAAEIKYYVDYGEKTFHAQAGMYYGRVLSDGEGVLKVERIPVAPPDGDATVLRYGKPATILPNDTLALYALRRDTFGLRFDCPTDHVVRMYLGKQASFTPATAFTSYQFERTKDGHSLFLDKKTIEDLWTLTTSGYIYVRFMVTTRTSVTPRIWTISPCADKWDRLTPGVVPVSSNDQTYHRFYYYDWKGGDMTIAWKVNTSGSKACTMWIGDTCKFAVTNTDEHYVARRQVQKNGSTTIPAATIGNWADRVDDDGNLYVRFDCTLQGEMTITSTAPEDTDPSYPMATIALACEGDKVLVKVSEAQSVVVEDALGAQKEAWEATPVEAHELTLPAGSYILKGKTEQIQITLP